jgi:hypothetical protein
MSEKIIERLFIECEKHKKMIDWAISKIKSKNIYPFTPEVLKNLDEDSISLIDKLTFRFSKLQETLGNIFWELLALMGENTEDFTFLDVLSRMEKYKIIDSSFEWQEFRRTKNIIAHEYETNYDLLSQSLNFFEKITSILKYYHNAKNFYEGRIRG